MLLVLVMSVGLFEIVGLVGAVWGGWAGLGLVAKIGETKKVNVTPARIRVFA